jgi:hypothetical protein
VLKLLPEKSLLSHKPSLRQKKSSAGWKLAFVFAVIALSSFMQSARRKEAPEQFMWRFLVATA